MTRTIIRYTVATLGAILAAFLVGVLPGMMYPG